MALRLLLEGSADADEQREQARQEVSYACMGMS